MKPQAEKMPAAMTTVKKTDANHKTTRRHTIQHHTGNTPLATSGWTVQTIGTTRIRALTDRKAIHIATRGLDQIMERLLLLPKAETGILHHAPPFSKSKRSTMKLMTREVPMMYKTNKYKSLCPITVISLPQKKPKQAWKQGTR